ncbi:MAG: AraC family transcriptional regulator [Verrucomicrobiota bacterium]
MDSSDDSPFVEELDTENSAEREILDLRRIGITHALTLGRYHYRKVHAGVGPQRHRQWLVLQFALGGRHTCVIDDNELELHGGQGLRVLPGEAYGPGGSHEKRGELAWLILDVPEDFEHPALGMSPAGAEKVLTQLLNPSLGPLFELTPGLPEVIASAFDARHQGEDLISNEIIANRVTSMVLASAVALGASRDCPSTTHRKRIERVLNWIRTHPQKDISSEEMAGISGLSPSHFSREFRKATGTSPSDFALGHRVEHAASVLQKEPGLSITEVAHELGFSSSQYFSTVFRRYMGVSPGEWRKRDPE